MTMFCFALPWNRKIHLFMALCEDSDSLGFSVYSRASVYYGRDGRAALLFFSALRRPRREVLVKAERRVRA